MADQAKITSLDALENFRSHLILFLSKTHSIVEEVSDDIRKTRGWLQNDQRLHWEREIRRRRRALDQAQQDLHSAKLSSFNDNYSLQMMAVRRAKQAADDAEEKLRNVKRWTRDYEFSLSPLAKKLDSLRGVIDHKLPKAASTLLQIQKTLDSYMELGERRTAIPPPETQSEIGQSQPTPENLQS